MEGYRHKLEKEIRLYIHFIAFIGILFSAGALHWIEPAILKAHTDFMNGFQMGILIAFQILAIQAIGRRKKALSSEQDLQLYYNERNDERIIYIRQMSGMTPLRFSGGLLVILSVITGYFNVIMSVTFLMAGGIVISIAGILKLYYRKKYK
jgi:hypothetical protein